MHRFSLLFIAFIPTYTVSAQILLPEGLSDTITPEAVEVKFYKSLDSVPGDTIYVIESPAGYVIQDSDHYSYIKVAIRTKSGYKVFDAGPDIYTRWPVTIDRINFNGLGRDELEIRWANGNGRSGWASGWNESSSRILIWDLDRIQLLFSFQDSFEYNFWWNGVEYDSSGNLMTDSLGDVIMIDSLSGGESSCDKYDVTIELKKITIHRNADCALTNTDDGAILRQDETTWIYDLKRDGLVLRKE